MLPRYLRRESAKYCDSGSPRSQGREKESGGERERGMILRSIIPDGDEGEYNGIVRTAVIFGFRRRIQTAAAVYDLASRRPASGGSVPLAYRKTASAADFVKCTTPRRRNPDAANTPMHLAERYCGVIREELFSRCPESAVFSSLDQ